MSIIGEQIAEEWLNRQGFFTIRGARAGNGEMDLLAVGMQDGSVECWHFEVQFSLRPISYICAAPKELRDKGKSAYNASKRQIDEKRQAVKEWVHKKFADSRKENIRNMLWPGKWGFGLIVGNVKDAEELKLISEYGIKIVRMVEHLADLSPLKSKHLNKFIIPAAGGSDLLDLVFAHEQLKK